MLSVNIWDEDRDSLRRFVAEKGLEQRVLLHGIAVYKTYGLVGLPVSVWIDRAGIIRDVEFGFRGPEPIEQKTKRLVEGK